MLTAGTYSTVTFEPGLTYTVSEGWSNYEDLPGNFLLIPPGATITQENDSTLNYIAAFYGVAAASADCAEKPQVGVATTPEAIADWLSDLEGIAATRRQSVTLGGLDGVVLDLRIADGYTEGCPYPGFEGTPMVPMIIRDPLSPSDFHHVVIVDTKIRLYLLEGPLNLTVAIEIGDVAGGPDIEQLDAVVQTFEFGTART